MKRTEFDEPRPSSGRSQRQFMPTTFNFLDFPSVAAGVSEGANHHSLTLAATDLNHAQNPIGGGIRRGTKRHQQNTAGLPSLDLPWIRRSPPVGPGLA
jgi:hypothetical protein